MTDVATIPGPGVHDLTDDVTVQVRGSTPARVDAADQALVAPYNWRAQPRANGKVYVVATWANTTLYMHRLILGAPSGADVDHINNDGLDNRRANLRLASRSQNLANTRKRAGTYTSQFKGVYRARRKWAASIKVNQVRKSLGEYHSEEDAARAYDAAARAAWGPFARLNFPEDAS